MEPPSKRVFRVAITGPESTGKSTLAKQLAEYYQTVWVPEYARAYLDQLHRPYEEEDLLRIAQGQIAAEEEMEIMSNELLFCDTELTVIKIWSSFKYGNVDPFILSEAKNRSYDLFLLMDIDLPWEYDSQREHPEKRKYFFDWFERELRERRANYHIIKGSLGRRFQMACDLIDRYFK